MLVVGDRRWCGHVVAGDFAAGGPERAAPSLFSAPRIIKVPTGNRPMRIIPPHKAFGSSGSAPTLVCKTPRPARRSRQGQLCHCGASKRHNLWDCALDLQNSSTLRWEIPTTPTPHVPARPS